MVKNTSNYLLKYKGKYRLKAPIDLSTNDFPRKLNGTLEDIDVCIICKNNGQIFYYGHRVLQYYIPSIKRGNSIIRELYSTYINPDNTKENIVERTIGDKVTKTITHEILDQDVYESDMKKSKLIFDIEQTDSETLFKFHDKNSDKIFPFLKPSEYGSSISPFSTKNLPKCEYEIPTEDLLKYKAVLNKLNEDERLKVAHVTTQFLNDKVKNKPMYRRVDLGKEMRKQKLKSKEFIHSIGMWKEYISYLDSKL